MDPEGGGFQPPPDVLTGRKSAGPKWEAIWSTSKNQSKGVGLAGSDANLLILQRSRKGRANVEEGGV
jgi:hypothetical protein